MCTSRIPGWRLLAGALAICLTTGCATKGYVNSHVDELRLTAAQRADSLAGEAAALQNSVQDAMKRAEAANGTAEEARQIALGRAGLEEVSSRTVYFAFDSDKLDDSARSALDQVAGEILSHPEAIVDVYGFTDSRGSVRYNYDLGQRRADAVVRYLVQETPGPLGRYAAVSFGKQLQIKGREIPPSDRPGSRRVMVSLLKRIPLDERQQNTAEAKP